MELRPVEFGDALVVALAMREWDRREIFATRWNDSPVDLARDCAAIGPFGWTAHRDGPIAVIGALPMWPGVWNVFMFATDRFREIRFSLTKFVRRVMVPALVESGAHRAECHSMEGHDEAHAWLEALGARREAVLRRYGRNGENFATYVWDRLDVRTQDTQG